MRAYRALTAFFVVSGGCSLVYQVVWLRLTMAHFGVTTPMVSILLSVFMAGLALGSWLAGKLARRQVDSSPALAMRWYALAELVIASSVFAITPGLAAARRALALSTVSSWSSLGYYLGAAAWTTALLLPFCIAMGATFPLAMWAIRAEGDAGTPRSFSGLYLANVVGATLGTLVSAVVLIELFGLSGTLHLAAAMNSLLACGALALSLVLDRKPQSAPARSASLAAEPLSTDRTRAHAVLFTTGFVSLGMEVVWVRQLTPYLGNLVYSFAIILSVYLVATFVGSICYRRWGRLVSSRLVTSAWPWLVLGIACLALAIFADPRFPVSRSVLGGALRAVLGIGPFCLLVGFMTPLVVDRLSGGDPSSAGTAYAVNVVGGILGPLFSGFVLLPLVPESGALLVFGSLILLFAAWSSADQRKPRQILGRAGLVGLGVAVAIVMVMTTRNFESVLDHPVILRDHTATVAATGTGMGKQLVVNGIAMTYLTPITKMMAHLPLALLQHPPRAGLVICFGMGTTFRSAYSWGISATAVELVPSVPALFGLFHADGPSIAETPRSRIVVDDGRRFLEYTAESYDTIIIDPPPPMEAAGSSLLYSVEFYDAARLRLKPGGIVQQWIPGGEPAVIASFARAFHRSFDHVRAFPSVEGWGIHMLGSDRPIEITSADTVARRLPEAAVRDLLEWGPYLPPAEVFELVFSREIPFEALLSLVPGGTPLRDDKPVNEYFLVRRALQRWRTARSSTARPASETGGSN